MHAADVRLLLLLFAAPLLLAPRASSRRLQLAAPASCTLSVTGPALSLQVCHETADELSTAPDLLSNGVRFISSFVCSACNIAGGSGNGTCYATITATLQPQQLLQFYANAWAAPVGGSYGPGLSLVNQSNPTCSPTTGHCSDLFPLRLSVLLDGVCSYMYYKDSCGGHAVLSDLDCTQPLLPLLEPPPLPPSPLPPVPSPPLPLPLSAISPPPTPHPTSPKTSKRSPPPRPPPPTPLLPPSPHALKPPFPLPGPPPPAPSTPPPFPSPTPSIRCVLTLTSSAASLSACSAYLVQLGTSSEYVTGLTIKPTMAGCGGCLAGQEADNTCEVEITGTFYSTQDLLQFYANAGALPVNTSAGYAPIALPLSQSSLPNNAMIDFFALETVHDALGDGCGDAVLYRDSCGGLGVQNLVFECPGSG